MKIPLGKIKIIKRIIVEATKELVRSFGDEEYEFEEEQEEMDLTNSWQEPQPQQQPLFPINEPPTLDEVELETMISTPELPTFVAVDDDLSFDEAFAHVREEKGKDGCFEWQGRVYHCLYEEELDALSKEEQIAHGKLCNESFKKSLA